MADNTAMSQKILTGFACNPNVYGVVIIGLGCETVGHKQLREKIQKMTDKPVVSFGIQEEGGTLKTIEKATRAARELAAQAGLVRKEWCDISELLMGIECGGSDATSGIASNPAVGELSDLLVDLGASTIMSESIEWIGGEHIVAKRGATPKIHNQVIRVCEEYEKHLKQDSQHLETKQEAFLHWMKRVLDVSVKAEQGRSLKFWSRRYARANMVPLLWIQQDMTSLLLHPW